MSRGRAIGFLFVCFEVWFLIAYIFIYLLLLFFKYLTGRGSYCPKVYCHLRLYLSWSFGLREQAFVCLNLLVFSELLASSLLKVCYQFSHSVMSDSLWPHGLQHAKPPCPSPTLGACSNSCPLSQRCQPAISSSVIPFSSCLQSFPASGSFPVSHFSHQVAKILELQLQHQSFQWIFRTDFL